MKGQWKVCINPDCKGKYHLDENKIVDIPCKCQARMHKHMMAFNRELAGHK